MTIERQPAGSPKQAEGTQCPACGRGPAGPFARVRGRRAAQDREFDYLECHGCGTVFLSPQTPAPGNLYTAAYFAPGAAPGGLQRRLGRFWTRLSLGLFYRRSRPFLRGTRLMEVGFGAGAWMEYLAERGWEVHGLDPSEEACIAARRRGLSRVTQGYPGDPGLPRGLFDVVMAVHCIEHDPDPRRFARQAGDMVRPGGWLGLVFPDITSWEARRARETWFHLDPPYHLCLPSPRALRRCLEDAGFSDIRQQCPVLDYAQSVSCALFRRPVLPMPLALLLLPFAMMANAFLAIRQCGGVVEFWARKPEEGQGADRKSMGR